MSNDFLNLKAAEELPESWRPTTIGNVATLQRGNDLSVSERRTGPFPVVGANGITGWHDTFVAKGPGVFVGRSGSVGKVTWVETDYWPLNTALWVKDFHGNDRQFIFYFLSSLNLSRVAAGVSVPTLNRNLVHPLRVVIPGEKEQRAIAGVLRTVQGAKEACEQVLAASRQLKQSLLHHLFTYGPIPFPQAAHVPLKETEIGEIPAHWDIVPLGEGFSVFSGFAFKSQDFTTEGIPVIKIGNLQGGTVVIDKGTSYFPRHLVSSVHDKFALHAGDVLIAMTGATTGKVSTLPANLEGALLNQRVGKIALREDSQLLLDFVKRFVATTFFQTEIQENILKSAQGNISPKSIERILVPRTPLPEQRDIAAQLSAVDAKLAAEESRRSALAALFQSLLHKLMTGQVRLPEFVRA